MPGRTPGKDGWGGENSVGSVLTALDPHGNLLTIPNGVMIHTVHRTLAYWVTISGTALDR